MRRIALFGYGMVCYLIFFGTFLYSVGFIANWVVPRTLDSGPAGPWGLAVVVDVALLGVFALQHSVMARPGFKRWWTRIIPAPVERATYVLATCAVLALLYWQWRPIPDVVWQTEGAAHVALQALFVAGVGLVLYATLLIDHFELFGLKQVARHLRQQPLESPRFVTPSLYRFVRHPLYLGWFTVLWAAPVMTVGHVLFAGVATGYILLALVFEERDLVDEFGDTYRSYQETTPAFLPIPRRPPGRSAAPTH